MAANKFATMLHKNTNKITLILIYAVLEWTLIVLLLVNSLFSYLIIKFAEYFGLKQPCLWCCRVDHLFDDHRKNDNNNIHRDLLCEAHAIEVSELSYCSKHRKLAESKHRCEDCLLDNKSALLFSWTKDVRVIENGKEMALDKCCCCDMSLENKFSTPLFIESDDDHLDQKRSDEHRFFSDVPVVNGDVEEMEGEEGGEKVRVVVEGVTEYIEEKYKQKMMKTRATCEAEAPQHLEFFIDCSGHTLVPIECIDSTNESEYQEKDENEVVECMKKIVEDENDLVFYGEECHSEREVYGQSANKEHAQEASRYHQVQILAAREREEEEDEDGEEEEEKEENSDVPPEEFHQMINDETDGEVSIGTEIPDLDQADEVQCHETLTSYILAIREDQETEVELKTLSVDLSGHVVMNNQSLICSDLNENEEDKVPDTPTSIDSFHQLHQKLLLLEKKDPGTEDSLDGSVVGVSDLESGDTASTIEHLKSALKAERKALHSLYAELEEERSASAVATSQTMAMINRLQEEKAAMQMEALQYQRMMEEQSEYDQEALQLMNELMVKREKEKQEVEKELEAYRKRLLDYEAKEKMMRMLKRSKASSTRSVFSSASCSNAEDSDELSIDLNQETKEDDSFYYHQECLINTTPVDAVMNLAESLADFEEERMAILEQLKLLEEKLISLDDEDAKHLEDVRPMEDSYRENGNHIDEHSHFHGEMNGHANGFYQMNGKHHPERRIVNVKGKRLLPLFDATSDENEDGYHSNGVHDSYIRNFDMEEELDHLHERLQALEADREFLKNCVSSLKKGDKGMDLLQEILQHLRDLRNVELRARSLSGKLE